MDNRPSVVPNSKSATVAFSDMHVTINYEGKRKRKLNQPLSDSNKN